MEIKRLRYFISVVDKGSIGRAATAASMAQPVMSQHMAAIETEIGVRLLTRSPQGVEPTPAGMFFYRSAQAIVRRWDEAVRETVSAAGMFSGAVSVGLPTSMVGVLGSPLLEMMMEAYPSVRTRITESFSGHLTEMALNGRLDVVFIYVDQPMPGLDVRPALIEEMFLLSSAPSVSQTVTLTEVAMTPLVLPGPEHGLRKIVEGGLAKIGMQPEIRAEIDSYPLLMDSVRRGVASTVTSWAGMTGIVAPTGATRRRIIEPNLTRPVAMCLSEASLAVERIEEMADSIMALVRALVESGQWGGVRYVGTR